MSDPLTAVGESATRRIVRRRSWGMCEICGSRPATDKAHRVGVGVGGQWNPSNILDACRECHRENHGNPAAAYASGQHLKSHQNPLVEPVVLVVRGVRKWVLLSDGGAYMDAPTAG